MAQNEQIGGVYYTIDADSSQLLTAEQQVNKSTRAMQREFEKTDQTVAGLNTELNNVQPSANNAAGALNKLTPAAQGVQSATNSLRGAMGSLGYQVQDIVVQAQAGTSAFMIFAQQGSQIASAFGPAGAVYGAVIALAGAIGGVLFNSITKTNEVSAKLPESVTKWLEQLATEYEKLDELSKRDFAQAQIGKIETASAKADEEVNRLTLRLEKLKKFGLLGEAPDVTASLPQVIAKTSEELDKAKKRADEFTVMLNQLNKIFTEGLATTQVNDGLQDASNKVDGIIARLEAQKERLQGNEEAALKVAAAQELGLKVGEQLPPEVEKAIGAYVRARQEVERLKEAKKETLQIQKEISDEIDRELKSEIQQYEEQKKQAQLAAEEELAAENKKYNAMKSASQSVAQELETPAQQAKRQLDERLKVYQDYYGLESLEQAKRTEEGIAAEQAYQKRLTEIQKQEQAQRHQVNMTTLQSFGDFFGNLASIAEQGGKDQFQTYKNLASMQAAISATMAVLNVLANPMIPYPLNIGLAASMAGLAGAQVAKIQSMQYSGGRLYGGPVSPGNVYPITENGRPEILQQGNKQYLLPGSRGGNVISNRDMVTSAGGSNVEVVVNNYSGEAVAVNKTQQGSGMTAKEVIQIVVGDINRRGEIHRSITGSTTASNRT